MKTPKTNVQKTEHGQSLLEFAVSLIVLLFLLTGSVEFGMALFQFITIRDAAQEGALYGSINPTDTDGITWRAMDAASDVVQISATNITINYTTGAACEGETGNVPNAIEVVVVFDHPVTLPFVADMIGNGVIRLTGRATNTILQPPCP